VIKIDKSTIKIDGIEYIKKSKIQQQKVKLKKGLTYCIIRTYSAGVFSGWIDRKIKGKINTIFDSRRIWYWEGAASLSQLANDGTKKPDKCKFSQLINETDLTEIIEIIPCLQKAKESIEGVFVWEK